MFFVNFFWRQFGKKKILFLILENQRASFYGPNCVKIYQRFLQNFWISDNNFEQVILYCENSLSPIFRNVKRNDRVVPGGGNCSAQNPIQWRIVCGGEKIQKKTKFFSFFDF